MANNEPLRTGADPQPPQRDWDDANYEAIEYRDPEWMDAAREESHMTGLQTPPPPAPRTQTMLRGRSRPLSQEVMAAFRAMRMSQWTKNGLVALAAVFSGTLIDRAALGRVALAFLAFSLASSAIYIINDIADREHDRRHPTKRLRPIASGALSIPGAALTAALCIAGAAGATTVMLLTPYAPAVSHGVDPFASYGGGALLFVLALVAFVAQNILYSVWLKHFVLWDVFSIALGFVLRALAGAFAVDVYISPWFYLCTIFLSLFLALGKRRAELAHITAAGTPGATRRNLEHYTLQLLDQLIMVVVACAVMSYSLYTFLGVPGARLLMITVPMVIFGVSRYLYLVYVKAEGERPDELLVRDRQILGVVALYVVVVVAILYAPLLREMLTAGPLAW